MRKTNFVFITIIYLFFNISNLHAQYVNLTRYEVVYRGEDYLCLYNPLYIFNVNIAKNNYYDLHNVNRNHSTWREKFEPFSNVVYEDVNYAPYGFGVKDTPAEIEMKMVANLPQGPVYESLFQPELMQFTLNPGNYYNWYDYLNYDSTETFVIPRTEYLNNHDYCTITIMREHTGYPVDIYLINEGYVDGNVVGDTVWSYYLTRYDTNVTENTEAILNTGKYYLRVSTDESDYGDIFISITKPKYGLESVYACGAHSDHRWNSGWTDDWAFGIDCSGLVSYSYDLDMLNTGANDYFTNNWYRPTFGNTDEGDCLARSDHVILIRHAYESDGKMYCNLIESTVASGLNPDGVRDLYDMDITLYTNVGYIIKSPWQPTGVGDYIFITDCSNDPPPRYFSENQINCYLANFEDEYPQGDPEPNDWYWEFRGLHSEGYVVFDTSNSNLFIIGYPDVGNWNVEWEMNESGNIKGEIWLFGTTADDSYEDSLQVEIEYVEPPQITACLRGNQEIQLEFPSGYYGLKIFYDTDSGDPYNGTGAAEGDSPITFEPGSDSSFVLSGLTNGTTYYIAMKRYDPFNESDYSNEEFATPITLSGTLAQSESWPGAGNPGTVDLEGDVIVPALICLTIESGATVNLIDNNNNGYNIKLSGDGSIIIESDNINPDIRLEHGSTLKGQYPSSIAAFADAAGGDEVEIYSEDSWDGSVSVPVDVKIARYGYLFVDKGTSVNFTGNTKLRVYGELLADSALSQFAG